MFFSGRFFFLEKENNGENSQKKSKTSSTGSTGCAAHKTPVNGHDASEGQLSQDEWSRVCVRGGGAAPAHSPRSVLLGTSSAGPHAEFDRAPFPFAETYSPSGAVRSFLAVPAPSLLRCGDVEPNPGPPGERWTKELDATLTGIYDARHDVDSIARAADQLDRSKLAVEKQLERLGLRAATRVFANNASRGRAPQPPPKATQPRQVAHKRSRTPPLRPGAGMGHTRAQAIMVPSVSPPTKRNSPERDRSAEIHPTVLFLARIERNAPANQNPDYRKALSAFWSLPGRASRAWVSFFAAREGRVEGP